MEKVVLILHAAPEHLLIPERILLRCQTVFFSKKDDRIKIAYVPRPRNDAAPGAGSISGFHRELILLLTQLKQDLRDGHADLLTRLIREIYSQALDTKSLLRQIGLSGAVPGMLAFKGAPTGYAGQPHHVGLVAECGGRPTVIHASSTKGEVVEEALRERDGWTLLAVHRLIRTGQRKEADRDGQ